MCFVQLIFGSYSDERKDRDKILITILKVLRTMFGVKIIVMECLSLFHFYERKYTIKTLLCQTVDNKYGVLFLCIFI